MSRKNELVQYAPVTSAVEVVAAEPEGAEQPANPLLQLHSLLRGRYWLAIVLGVIGVVAGGYAGYTLRAPAYTSTGMIRVQPYLPRILYESEQQNGIMPMFDAFVGSQIELMQGQRVTDLAIQDPDWSALGRGMNPQQIVAFRESLTVSRPKGSAMIIVEFEDDDPTAARIAVASVIEAYQGLYSNKSGDGVEETIVFLENRRTTLTNQLNSLNDRIFDIANSLGLAAIDQMYEHKLDELNKVESELRRAELAVAFAKSAGIGAAEQEGSEDAATPLSTLDIADALAMQFPEIAHLRSQTRNLERQIKIDRGGLGENHPQVRKAEQELAVFEEELAGLVATYEEAGLVGGDAIATKSLTGFAGQTLAQLQATEQNIQMLYDKLRTETQGLGRKSLEIDELRAQASDTRQKLDETKIGLEKLLVESNVGGRISVESTGDQPLAPSTDKRKQFAAAGSVGLGGLGVGVVLLLGLIDRRIRSISDVSEGVRKTTRILGVLPELPSDLSDPEQAALAAHGVHQIRMLLQGRHRSVEHPVIAITSPSPGSGKTSLSLALGISFAASHTRTLLIDCDVVGGGLTAKMKSATRRRLGHILRRKGIITSSQLVEAVKRRLDSNMLLGEVLVELGYATASEIDDAIEEQQVSPVGLREALNGEPLQECLAETGIPGLFLLPLGSAERHHAGELSYSALRNVVERAREWFDMIIVDTGPILGSLEASVVGLVADEVVLTVARGENRARVQQSIQQIHSSGAHLSGVVLNRAAVPDIAASSYSASTSRLSDGSAYKLPERLTVIEHKNLWLGPIGGAVAAIGEARAVEPRRSA